MDKPQDMLNGFTETLRLFRETLRASDTHQVKLNFIGTFHQLLSEAAPLIEADAFLSQYGHLRGLCETVVMFECLLDHEQEGSFGYYEAYRRKVDDYMASLGTASAHAENDRPHQYDWYNAMKRGGFTTSKVSLKTLANHANSPLLETFHILNVKIHNAEYFSARLENPRFRDTERAHLQRGYLMVLNHILRIFTLHLKTDWTKPLLDAMVERRNHMKRILSVSDIEKTL